ncbi:MAG: hypothetical protein JWL76_295 [Thermoleophilia bacterium]|nr:hypothetical protein [Thermoleophilia bacterium]
MEPLVPQDLQPSTSSDPRERIEDVLLGRVDRSDIDVRTFLLDPPPTDAELARTERRRMFVRRGSVSVAAIVAILLVAPWPGGGADRASAPGADAGIAEAGMEPRADPAPQAVRLDAEPAPTTRSRSRTRRISAGTPAHPTRHVPRHAHHHAVPTPRVPVHQVTPAAARAPTPAPRVASAPVASPTSNPAPAPAGGAILAPVL